MKAYTESEALKHSGNPLLEPHEVRAAAEEVVSNHGATVIRCLISGDYTDLRSLMKRCEKDAREKKGLNAWIAGTGAIWDQRQQMFFVSNET